MDQNNNPDADASVKNLKLAEGFARITRDGETDIYLVQNMCLPGGYGVSFAFDLDDFAADKNVGHPLVLQKGDVVEHLGAVMDYLAPVSPHWEIIVPVTRAIPRNCGLLPTVRAVEILGAMSAEPTSEDVEKVVDRVLDDYYRRRAMLEL